MWLLIRIKQANYLLGEDGEEKTDEDHRERSGGAGAGVAATVGVVVVVDAVAVASSVGQVMVHVAENAVDVAVVGRVGGGVVAVIGVGVIADTAGGTGQRDGVDVTAVATVADFGASGAESAVLAVGGGALVVVAGSVSADENIVGAVEAAHGGVVVEAGTAGQGDGAARGTAVGDVVAVIAHGADAVRGVAQAVADAAGLLACAGRVDIAVGAERAGGGVGAAAAHLVFHTVTADGSDGLERESDEDEFRGESCHY